MEEKAENSQRRTNKPLMEKRRRARINMCLGELKNLVLLAMNKDNSQFSKLEKADILEMAVKYLRHVQSSSMATAAVESTVMAKYQMGYGECAREVMTCLGQNGHVDEDLRNRISDHLTKCLYSVHTAQSHAIAMRGFQTIPVMNHQMGDGRLGAPPGGIPYPGHSVLRVNPGTSFISNRVSHAVKQEPNIQVEPQNLSLSFPKHDPIKAIKREPVSPPQAPFGRHTVGRTPPICLPTKPQHVPVFPPSASTSVPLPLGNSARFSPPSSAGLSDVRCVNRKRALSEDGNCRLNANVASAKQRRLTDYSAAANKPVDESVWRPW